MNQPAYGCHNREPFRESVLVQDGWIETIVQGQLARVARMKAIPFRNMRECGYQLSEIGKADPRCVGCCWKVRTSPSQGQDQ
jgi:hypothetical protein